MKRLIIIALLLGVTLSGWSQQQYTFTNYMLNDYYYSPAIAGSRDAHIATLGYRSQWTGFEEAPVTLIGNYYGSVKNRGKHGFGVSVINDRTGLVNNSSIYLNYAQHFRLTEKVKFGLGVQPGFLQYRVRLYDARLADQGDDVLTGNILSANALDMHAGFHLYSDKYYVMGTIQHLLGEQITFTSYNASLAKHYSLIGGYNWHLKKQKLMIQPSLMMRYVSPLPIQWSFMVKATYDKKLWAGLGYRTGDAASVVVGYEIKERLNLGYGFDYSVSGISNYQSGSHELVLSYKINIKKPSLEEEDEKLNNSILDEMNKRLEEEKEDN